ncbi:MAG: bacterio-opsin activator domain-containing protein [Halarchaeum sp.]
MSEKDRPAAAVELAFSFGDASYPFVAATEDGTCAFELAEMIPRAGERYAEFFTITGTSPERILSLTEPFETIDASLLHAYDDGGFFEFLATGNCPAFSLAELGALPRRATSADGEGRIVADVPPRYDETAVIEGFLDENSDAELVSKRERSAVTPTLSHSAFRRLARSLLTDRQREVVRAAYDAGYYEWPREGSTEDVADALDISTATVSEHIRAAERKLLAAALDRSGAR